MRSVTAAELVQMSPKFTQSSPITQEALSPVAWLSSTRRALRRWLSQELKFLSKVHILEPLAWPAIDGATVLFPDHEDKIAFDAGKTGRRAQRIHGGILVLPAEFLIDPTGRVLVAHYGGHADDSLSVDQLIDAAERGN